MMYAIFREFNHDDKQEHYYFLQYTGNEEKLNALVTIIEESNFDSLSGDYSEYGLDSKNLLSKKTVDEMIKTRFYFDDDRFEVCNGIFEFYEEDFEGIYCNEKALKLDDLYHNYQIIHYFN